MEKMQTLPNLSKTSSFVLKIFEKIEMQDSSKILHSYALTQFHM